MTQVVAEYLKDPAVQCWDEAVYKHSGKRLVTSASPGWKLPQEKHYSFTDATLVRDVKGCANFLHISVCAEQCLLNCGRSDSDQQCYAVWKKLATGKRFIGNQSNHFSAAYGTSGSRTLCLCFWRGEVVISRNARGSCTVSVSCSVAATMSLLKPDMQLQ